MSQPIKIPAVDLPDEIPAFEFEITVEHLPAGSTVTVWRKADGTWPARPTARTDIHCIWKGKDPDPQVVPTGTGGMLDNMDTRMVTK